MDTLGLARILDLHGDVARDVAQAGEMSETELAGVETIRSTVKTLRKAVYQCSN